MPKTTLRQKATLREKRPYAPPFFPYQQKILSGHDHIWCPETNMRVRFSFLHITTYEIISNLTIRIHERWNIDRAWTQIFDEPLLAT